ncbi:MAG: fibrobacter succinogenes major paralogous domain-containing protein [Bacteroidetes bacterium]|nr:fibrobacter succinogenes major paralogous domain-containing protein [Bacteroidota bacterium]
MKGKLLLFTLLMAACALYATRKTRLQQINGIAPYHEVVIGKQTWMGENLNVSTFRNGDTIPEARTIEEWRAAGKDKKPAWCYYNNDIANGALYGKLYNFYAITDARGLAPKGWKIPAANDWVQLSDFLGGQQVAGHTLKSTTSWYTTGNGTNASGFSGLASGSRTLAVINQNNGFGGLGRLCYWWSTTSRKGGDIMVYSLFWKNKKFTPIWDTFSSDGYAVRCIKE